MSVLFPYKGGFGLEHINNLLFRNKAWNSSSRSQTQLKWTSSEKQMMQRETVMVLPFLNAHSTLVEEAIEWVRIINLMNECELSMTWSGQEIEGNQCNWVITMQHAMPVDKGVRIDVNNGALIGFKGIGVNSGVI